MSRKGLISAKAKTSAEQSDSIVVSFDEKWLPHLRAKDFTVVIRKRVPKNDHFRWIYLHINSPVCAICGRVEIERIFSLTTNEAIAVANEINMPSNEIASYIGAANSIGCYKLGEFQFGAKDVPMATLVSKLAYFPPQSFLILSKKAKMIVDQLAGY